MKPGTIIRRIAEGMSPDDGDPMATMAGLLAELASDAVITNRMLLMVILGLCRQRPTLWDPEAERVMLSCLLRDAHTGEFDCVGPDDMVTIGAAELVEAHRMGTLAQVIGKARLIEPPATVCDPCDASLVAGAAPAKLYDAIMASSRASAARAAYLRDRCGPARVAVAQTIRRLAARRRIIEAARRVTDMVDGDDHNGAVRATLAEALADAEAL